MKKIGKISEFLPQINEKNQYYFLGGILLFIFLLDYFVLMQWQLKTLRTLNPKITILANDIKTAKDNIQRIEQYEVDSARLKEQAENLKSGIVLREELPVVLESVSRLAKASGVQIDQVQPVRESQDPVLSNKEGKYYVFSFLVNARGGYHNLGRFIDAIETGQVFLNVTKFEFLGGADNTSAHTAQITIDAIIFEAEK